jgi:hypothetical protein
MLLVIAIEFGQFDVDRGYGCSEFSFGGTRLVFWRHLPLDKHSADLLPNLVVGLNIGRLVVFGERQATFRFVVAVAGDAMRAEKRGGVTGERVLRLLFFLSRKLGSAAQAERPN